MSTSGRGQLLVPWPNRVRDGSYEFDGHWYQLPLDDPEEQDAIHGLVRWAAWRVGEREPDRVVMEHTLHPQPGYPFTLELAVEYLLSDEGLRVRMMATNAGPVPCPYGCGAHPYLTLGTESVDSLILRAPARTVLLSDERGIPLGAEFVEGTERDFRRPRAIGATRLDYAFTELERDADGLARIRLRDPGSEAVLTLWVDESYPYVMLFTGDPLPDGGRRSLAIEPMTCPPNALQTGEALVRLEPGDSFTGSWGMAAVQPA
jgi:aldose 1-epimerase